MKRAPRVAPASLHRAALTDREALLFEAGIKLGGLFHQYLGTPVSPRSAPSLASAIEAALSLQPFVRAARVRIDPSRGDPLGRGPFRYRYLTAEMLRATVVLADGRLEVTATLRARADLRYPLMSVDRVRPRASAPKRASPAARR